MDDLLKAMSETPAVPEGWDLALNLSQNAVQSLLLSNWEGGTGKAKERGLTWLAPTQVDGQHDILEVRTDLSSPTVALDDSASVVTLTYGIDTGVLRIGKVSAERAAHMPDAQMLLQTNDVSWSNPVDITSQNPLRLAGAMPLVVRPTPDGQRFAIALDISANGLTLTSADEGGLSSHTVAQPLTQWLSAQNLTGQIASFARANKSATVSRIAPDAVSTRMGRSVAGDPVLQILAGLTPDAPVEGAGRAIPHPDGYDFSVLVSSKSTMAMIVSGYNQGTGEIKLVSMAPSSGDAHWFAQIHEPMIFEGTFGTEDGQIFVTDRSEQYLRFGGSPDQGLRLFTFTDPASSVHLHLEIAAHYPTAISGTGADQRVGLSEGGQSINGEGFYENIVKPQLENFLTGQIRSDMTRVQMTAISDFLLRDMVLTGHRPRFEISALPAELVIAGHLEPTP
ncbi:hypothetical protein [Rhodospirillum sp. A1_3_36]|uniref:hypothetical protein n=1 Tax=Rhodospirillum sp. A1_3_36 TaxID=3391666 RepID=UPI0039A40FBB